MKDAFGRDIKVGDTVVYGVRRGSGQDLNVAVVQAVGTKIPELGKPKEYVTASTVAGTGYDFTFGKWNSVGSKREPYAGREVTLAVSKNVMIANGIDVNDIIARQKAAVQERA